MIITNPEERANMQNRKVYSKKNNSTLEKSNRLNKKKQQLLEESEKQLLELNDKQSKLKDFLNSLTSILKKNTNINSINDISENIKETRKIYRNFLTFLLKN